MKEARPLRSQRLCASKVKNTSGIKALDGLSFGSFCFCFVFEVGWKHNEEVKIVRYNMVNESVFM